ncbi:MAG TPA: nucleotidyltransferase [Acidobacteriaceae bacterium]
MFMLKDQIDLLSAFNDHGVEYLVIGGHAVNAYTQARFTKDLDLFIHGSEANGLAVYKALAQFGAPLADVSPSDFYGKPDQFFQVGIEPDRIDIMQSIPGVSFEEAWKEATIGSIEGLSVRFISREHLIANKLAAGRPRDLGDVDELKKFARKQ